MCPEIGLASYGNPGTIPYVALEPLERLLPNNMFGGRSMRRLGLVGLAVLVLGAMMSRPSEARIYSHGFGHCLHALHYDYSHSNNLSPYSYIDPAANWGPFFQCRMYYSPVYVYQPLLY
jgi:hypothetical protein